MLSNVASTVLQTAWRDWWHMSQPVKTNAEHLQAALEWLATAQDAQTDGGVSAYYSLFSGWAPSFIETTGYILSTFLAAHQRQKKRTWLVRAQRMADFIVSMQLENGGYRTYPPHQKTDSIPTIFNTGQDILGLCDYYQQTSDKKYLTSVKKAADFLVRVQEPDGRWLQYQLDGQPHTYDSRVAWALIRVGQLTKTQKYIKAGRRQLDWVLKQQTKNGWFKHSSLPGLAEPQPITHTIAYTIEGLWYAGLLLKNPTYQNAAYITATRLSQVFQRDQKMAATYDRHWQAASRYQCLTGNAQLVILWFEMARTKHQPELAAVAHQVLAHLKARQVTSGTQPSIKGGIAGSFPIYGSLLDLKGYCRCAYINWATKFYADALMAEDDYATFAV